MPTTRPNGRTIHPATLAARMESVRAAVAGGHHTASEIIAETGIPRGQVYTMLRKLTGSKQLSTRRDASGRPRYSLPT